MVLEILCVEPIYPRYSGVLVTCLALRYWFFRCLAEKVLTVFNSVGELFFYSVGNVLVGELSCSRVYRCAWEVWGRVGCVLGCLRYGAVYI